MHVITSLPSFINSFSMASVRASSSFSSLMDVVAVSLIVSTTLLQKDQKYEHKHALFCNTDIAINSPRNCFATCDDNLLFNDSVGILFVH